MKNIDIARLTPETWPARREALVKLFGQEEYGVVPAGWTSSFVWEKELEKDGLHGRLGCVTVEYKGRSMSFPFALWLLYRLLIAIIVSYTDLSSALSGAPSAMLYL